MRVQRSEIVDCHPVDRVRPAALGDPQELPASARVLIADPDQYLLYVYRKHLEQQGFAVTTAMNGLECVHKLREARPDVLVMDPCLPWGSGDGVLALISEDSDMPRIPVIILTDARDRGVLYRLAPFRVDDFQIKPLSGRQLTERIRAFVRRQPI